jgi:hypothetical protein
MAAELELTEWMSVVVKFTRINLQFLGATPVIRTTFNVSSLNVCGVD